MTRSLAEYDALSPDRVLDAIESVGLEADGRLMALNSYENRVYQIGLEGQGFVVAKFYRPNRWTDEAIEEEHVFTLRLADADIPVTPPMVIDGRSLHFDQGFRFAVFPRQGGREPALESDDNLAWMGRTLGRVHALGRSQNFAHRVQLLDEKRVAAAASYVVEADFVPPHQRQDYDAISTELVEVVAERFEAGRKLELQAIHGDCHRGNVLWTEQGPHLVDFDDCATGPVVADFWMLLDGEAEARRRQLEVLLEGYEQFADFDWRQLRLIEALKAARMIEYAAWIARRWDDPTFPMHFPWFGQPRFWEEHLGSLTEQLNRMQSENDGFGNLH